MFTALPRRSNQHATARLHQICRWRYGGISTAVAAGGRPRTAGRAARLGADWPRPGRPRGASPHGCLHARHEGAGMDGWRQCPHPVSIRRWRSGRAAGAGARTCRRGARCDRCEWRDRGGSVAAGHAQPSDRHRAGLRSRQRERGGEPRASGRQRHRLCRRRVRDGRKVAGTADRDRTSPRRWCTTRPRWNARSPNSPASPRAA